MFDPVDPKRPLPEIEHEILEAWEREDTFKKSVEKRKGGKKFVFFDGPPFANGLPHYGHILAGTIKDTATRYFNMRGFYTPRVNGWDCHGLPVEYEIEKELQISGKQQIESMGVAKFNAQCRESVFRYTEEWEAIMKRLARWVDFEKSYATLDNDYMESIWWVFKQIWDKKMVYQDYRSMHLCPRCETPLSNFEVGLGYKDVTDPSIVVKFRLLDEPNTYILAWTTTPWTLPGNALLAVGPAIAYVKVKHAGASYILAEKTLDEHFGGKKDEQEKPEIIAKLTAADLVGKRYEPLFPYYKDHANAFRVVVGDFVSTDEGTGIVHIAPGFGEDDMLAGKRENVKPITHVNKDGTFVDEVTLWAGKFVKNQELNIKDHLEKEGKLFSFKNYKHSYPHCWRCDTPLLNYVNKAWFIRVTDIKEKLLKNNQKIRWVPEHIKDGRFGKWLENVRDWNISRNRYWGAAMPVWECTDAACGTQKCIGSIRELAENSTGGNTYFFVRHGEAQQNVKGILNSDPKNIFHLTEKGEKQAEKAAGKLAKEKPDIIFSSAFPRARETAEIIAKACGIEATPDDHLREHEMGEFEGKSEREFVERMEKGADRYSRKIKGGESFQEVEERTLNFINFLSKKYRDKKIVIVTHGDVIRSARRHFERLSAEEMFGFMPDFAEVKEFYSGPLPLRQSESGHALDLHKPYIDDITFRCEKCGGEMKRIPEVLDCWFESGSMPYAQLHYPFENKEEFDENFPAQFIAEGLDQTRGWFYTLHVIATILFNKPAFENIIVNGIILAADGEKLSKRKKNYPDPYELFEKHGVDSTRFFLLSSTATAGQDVRFSEEHVKELVKQFTLPLRNTMSFFVTYANIDNWQPKGLHKQPSNEMDRWILSETQTLIATITEEMDNYNMYPAVRPLVAFTDKLSNWYVRRSRRRFWKSENDSDKNEAYETLYAVLLTLSKLLAPFMPFLADAMYRNLAGVTSGAAAQRASGASVHLEDWPKADKKFIDASLNAEMELVRTVVRLGHAIRAQHELKVRQPLAALRVALPEKQQSAMLKKYEGVILEELNVKRIEFLDNAEEIAVLEVKPLAKIIGPKFGGETQEIIKLAREGKAELQPNGSIVFDGGRYTLNADEAEIGYKGKEGTAALGEGGIVCALETALSEELLHEGYAREIIRHLQELRKEAGYNVDDAITILVETDGEMTKAVFRFAKMIKEETLAKDLESAGGKFTADGEKEMSIAGQKVRLAVRLA